MGKTDESWQFITVLTTDRQVQLVLGVFFNLLLKKKHGP